MPGFRSNTHPERAAVFGRVWNTEGFVLGHVATGKPVL
jgi:hypothetical protein